MVDKKGFRERELLEEGSRLRRQTIGRTKPIPGAGDTELDHRETGASCPDKGFRQNTNQEMVHKARAIVITRGWLAELCICQGSQLYTQLQGVQLDWGRSYPVEGLTGPG